MDDSERKIKVFASDDDLKSLGELLSNETSRKIICYLMTTETYTNEIATKLDLRVSLVIHHLKKMEKLGFVEIAEKKIIRKGEKHRFFKIATDFFITLDKNKQEVNEQGILYKIFKDGIKFTVIGLFGALTWLFDLTKFSMFAEAYPVSFGEDSPEQNSLTLGLIIIIVGLVIERIFRYRKK